MEKMKSLFLIAAFNEEQKIREVVEGVIAQDHHVLVVNDGSSDQTATILTELKAQYGQKFHWLSHAINLGQGAALQTGIMAARELRPTYLVTFDADGQHQVEDAESMMKFLAENPQKEIAIGSRFLGAAPGIPWMKKITLKAGVIFTRVVSGVPVTDTHNGLRVLTERFYQKFNFGTLGMEHASEILDYIALNRIEFAEWPVTIRYTDYSIQKGQSWTRALKLGLKVLGDKL